MKQLHKIILVIFLGIVAATGTSTIHASEAPVGDTVVTFRFLPESDEFLLKGNQAELERLYSLIDKYRTEIAAGQMPVYVDGYCASLPAEKENLNTAFGRASRVKSELITHKGLKEADFVTGNYARAYHNNKDVVVVTLRIPAKAESKQPEAVQEQPEAAKEQPEAAKEKPEAAKQQPQRETAQREEPKVAAEPQPQPAVTSESMQGEAPYRFAVRTNALYDAMLLPTLGVEWRINEHAGIRLDGSLSWWGGKHGKVQKMWLLNPEVRWYLLRDKRFYVGASGSYGEYNIYKYMPGNLLKDDTGYQGTMWNAGLTVGYRLPLSSCFSIDFNLGLGYTRSEYDSFSITDGVRVYEESNKTKNFWGPTQAGISLVWTIGNNRK